MNGVGINGGAGRAGVGLWAGLLEDLCPSLPAYTPAPLPDPCGWVSSVAGSAVISGTWGPFHFIGYKSISNRFLFTAGEKCDVSTALPSPL